MTQRRINVRMRAVSGDRCVHVTVRYKSLVITNVIRQDWPIQSEQKIGIEQ